MSKSLCRSCGAPLVWIKTAGGKSMPCDERPVMYWAEVGASGKVVTPNGEVVSCRFDGNVNTATGVGYISHFSTCSNAAAHRR